MADPSTFWQAARTISRSLNIPGDHPTGERQFDKRKRVRETTAEDARAKAKRVAKRRAKKGYQ